tara:strand:+ start:3485 stop:3811 length:327 start_codon:yes stop_codon:yes gene_type:complete
METVKLSDIIRKLRLLKPDLNDEYFPTSLGYEVDFDVEGIPPVIIRDSFGNEVLVSYVMFNKYLGYICNVLRLNGFMHLIGDQMCYYFKYEDAYICYDADNGLRGSLL